MFSKLKPKPKIFDPSEREKPLSGNNTTKDRENNDSFVNQLFGNRQEKQSTLNYTPLDRPQKNLSEAEQMDALRAQIKQEQEKDQQIKTTAQKRFEAVKEESKQVIEARRKQEYERKQQQVKEEQEKLALEQKKQQQPLEEPKGKIRRSIFSVGKPKKTAETKVGFGKQ